MTAQSANARTHERPASVLVRDAGPGDGGDMREVLEAAYKPFAALLPSTVFARYLADLLDLDRHARRGQLLVAEIGGRVRGTAAFYPNTFSQGLGWPRGWAGGRGMAVHPDARGLGAARALLSECESRARIEGARVFAVHTGAFMTDAIAMYERLGYCRIPHFDLDMTAHYGLSAANPIMTIAYRRNLHAGTPCSDHPRSHHRSPTVARPNVRPRRPV
jgi:GNAT superfamily N-acetyltransferase